MARDFNQNRIANAILGQATIDKYGNTFAVQFGLDGINIANVTVQPSPSSIIPYLEGDIAIKQYAVPINVDELCNYALASFPNIEELTLFSLDIVSVEDHLSYLSKLKIMYVNQNNLSSYSWFPTTIHSGYESFTSVDEYIGYVVVYNALPYIVNENNKNDLEIVAGTTIAYDKYLTNITFDYTYEIKDYTQDHKLTSDIITEQLNDLTSQQRNAITKLVIASTYTSASVDDVVWGYNFDTLLPYLNNNVWYNGSKFDFTTLTIQGSGTLTSEIVESSISGISSDKFNVVTKVVIDSGFTDISYILKNPLSPFTSLVNLIDVYYNGNLGFNELEYHYIVHNGYVETLYLYDDNSTTLSVTKTQQLISSVSDRSKVKLLKIAEEITDNEKGSLLGIWKNGDYQLANLETIDFKNNNISKAIGRPTPYYNYICRRTDPGYNNCFFYDTNSNYAPQHINKLIFAEATSNAFTIYRYYGPVDIKELYCPKLATTSSWLTRDGVSIGKIFMPIVRNMYKTTFEGAEINKLFIGTTDCSVIPSGKFTVNTMGAIYVKAESLVYYMTNSGWSNYSNKFVGYLDYTDTIPTFSGYTDQWYEDEDCTTPIATTDFVSGNRYYVKLQAI